MDVHTNRRLHGNAGREWTFVSAASCSPSHLHFTISIARLHRITTASGPSSIPFRRPASHIAEDPGPSIAIVTQDSSRIGPLRGFLPRGLFNVCPHALSLAHGFVVEGRRQTNLNVSGHFVKRPPSGGFLLFRTLLRFLRGASGPLAILLSVLGINPMLGAMQHIVS